MTRRRTPISLAAGVALLAACQELPTTVEPNLAPQFAAGNRATAGAIRALLDEMNVALDAAGEDYRAAKAEYITEAGSQEAGLTVLAKNVGNKQITAAFVPHDARRAPWSGPSGLATDDVTYAIDTTIDAVPIGGGLSGAQTDAAIVRAMDTWEGVNCSTLPLVRVPDLGVDIGVVAFLNGLGGSGFVVADVQHAGFRDINFAGGVLGVTFTFIFTSGGNATDIDGDGYADTAFTEIYYDPSWSWADDGVSNIDVQSVAVHEAGHGLSQAHFGNIAIKNDGSLLAAPRAVMNALYSGPFRELTGTDIGGHCSIWEEWADS